MKQQLSIPRLPVYAGRFRYPTIASWILSAASALMVLVPFVYIWMIVKEVLEVAPNFSSVQSLAYNGWMAVLFAALSLFMYTGGLMRSHTAASRIAVNIRSKVTHHIATLPLGFMDSFDGGKMRKIINESSAATETYLAHQLPDKVSAIATPIGLLGLLFFSDWRLGLLNIVPVILAFLIMIRITGEKMQQKMKEYQNALDDMSNEAVEYVHGAPVVKTFGQTVFSFKRLKASIDNYGKWVISYTKQLRTPMMGHITAINGVFVFLIGAGLYFMQDGVTNTFLISLILYIIITPVISITLTKIMSSSENVMIVEDALERIDSVLDIQPLKEETGHPVHPKNASMEFQNARFSYDGAYQAVDDVTLKIEQGKTVALVGPSDDGKSTLAALIARFFDVNEGSTRIGGADIREIPKAELMKAVSFVFQDSRLLKASILDNVRLVKPDAIREEVMKVLKATQCMDIIEKTPDGLDTIVGTRGAFLSGGEQQRTAITRVMLKNSPAVVLGKATAFADPDNESRVQAASAELPKEKTVIMIVHRLTTVADADEIFVLKDGKILWNGTYQQLLTEGGLYTEIWSNYQTSVKWKVGKEAVSC